MARVYLSLKSGQCSRDSGMPLDLIADADAKSNTYVAYFIYKKYNNIELIIKVKVNNF